MSHKQRAPSSEQRAVSSEQLATSSKQRATSSEQLATSSDEPQATQRATQQARANAKQPKQSKSESKESKRTPTQKRSHIMPKVQCCSLAKGGRGRYGDQSRGQRHNTTSTLRRPSIPTEKKSGVVQCTQYNAALSQKVGEASGIKSDLTRSSTETPGH